MAKRRRRLNERRRAPRREEYDRVLIVCEGEKTEVSYFSELLASYRISTANVKVVHGGSQPKTLVRWAKKLRNNEERLGEKYDRVYCVFDRDEHPSFKEASSEARSSGLFLARSWPCFEYWLLLHFGPYQQPFGRAGPRSPGHACVKELQRHVIEYSKGMTGLFLLLRDSLETAKKNTIIVAQNAEKTGSENPLTEVHDLVEYLQTLKSRS